MNKILFFLSTAFNVDDVKNIKVEYGQQRVERYINGINKFFEFDFTQYGHDISFIISDNTIDTPNLIDTSILEVIPDNVIFNFKDDNKFGSINKGSGVLTSWSRSVDEISQHDYILHFEPRLLMDNYNFLEDFLNDPRTLITIGDNKKHFNTGLFSFNSEEFLKFINSTSPQELAINRDSIEYTLFDFVINNNIKFDNLDKMGVYWHDANNNNILSV